MSVRARLFVAGAAVLLAAVLAAAAQPSSAGSRADNRRIVFTRSYGSTAVIASVTTSGKRLRLLTPRDTVSAFAAVSPDGKRLVYIRVPCAASCRFPRGDLWTMRVDGGHRRPLTRTARLSETAPSWSPDGGRIAYGVSSGGRGGGIDYGIWVMDANGSHRHQLTRHGYAPSWSPDGTALAFSWHDHVFVVPASGGRARDLTAGTEPDWSPDGGRIVYVYDDDLWVMNADASHAHPITHGYTYNERDPAWSPDGRWIAYTRAGHSFQICLVRPDGTGSHAITHPARDSSVIDESPDWS